MQDVTIQPNVRQRTVHVKKKKELDVDTHTYFTERLAPNFYIEQREGQVLSRGMLLKYDRFPSSKIIRSKSGVSISGGPNYRKIDDELPLCAVGQPSIHGIRTILNLLIGSPLRKQLTNNSDNILEDDIILMSSDATDSNIDSNINTGSCIWFNLREEPVVYLNNRPFVLRDSDHPFRNIQTFKGITYQHLGEVEQRLKRDILIEASKHNNILIHKENSNKLISPCWEGITYGSIKTSLEAFLSLFNDEGYNVKYYRIPLTPESDLLNETIDSIFKIVIKHTINNKLIPYFIMNCQMGRGRSTLVTILVWLIFNKLELITIQKTAPPSPKPNVFNAFSPPPPRKLFRIPSTPTVNITRSQSNPNFQKFRPRQLNSLKLMTEFSFKEQDEYSDDEHGEEHGDYEIIHRILRLLSNGMKAKENVDLAIERCGHLYDLKQEMAKCRLKLENAENDDEKELATLESQIILSKYCTLISFAAYLQSVNLDNICDLQVSTQFDFISNSFSNWLNERPSLQKIRKDITVLSYTDLMEKYRSKIPKTNLNAMLIFNRIGSVLGANSILKSDIIINKKKELFSDVVRNYNRPLRLIKFRFLKDVGIATCSQPPSNSIKSILNKIKLNDIEYKDENNNVIWIDLREEPILYIHSKPYVVRNYNRPFQRLPEFDNLLSAKQINDITERLKNDIINELMDNNNKILTHYESESHELLENILSINIKNKSEIETLQQIFYRLSNEEGYNVQYKKLPFNPQNSLQPLQLERLGEIITKHIQTNNIIIFNCRQGIHRSSVAAVLSVLIAYHIGTLTYINDINDINNMKNTPPQTPEHKRFKSRPNMPLLTPRLSPTKSEEDMEPMRLESDITYNNDNNNDNNNDSDNEIYSDDDIECFGVLSLIRILRHGLIMKRQVDNAVESFSEYYHVKNEIYSARAKWQASRTKEESDAYLQQAMRHLRIYTNLICYNAYLYEYYYAKKYNDTIKYKYKLLTFTQWIQSRLELKLWLKKMTQNPQLSLSMQNIGMDDEEKDDNNNKQSFSKVFHERDKKSSVLSGNAMLKVDYFPGCAQLIPNNNVQNAINFRYIDNIGLAGVAIPTTKAIKEIILFCAKKWILKNGNDIVPIHWICLREEPVLYVNDEPVVLRELYQPYENLIFTGITKKRVEAMEKALKEDAKKECLKFDNKLLIHSESDTGNLEAKWEEIENQKIMTCNEAYSNTFDNTCLIDINLKMNTIYERVPITDEQAPPPIIIDLFINIFEINSLKSIFIFNCQMGRGRTTTAMCIYALWKRKLNLYKLIEKKKPQKEEEKKNDINKEKKNKIKSYINGEFYAVLDLLRILPQGKKAKKWCDDVIDVLSHMQNLRKAIYKMKLRMDKVVNQKSKKHLKQKVKNYLQRYCLLIALTSYFLNDYKPPSIDGNNNKENNKNKRVTFQEWLEERAAVKNCIYSASLEKD